MSLRLVGVSKRYGAVDALVDLDLSAEPGELLVLLGPSGSGKSTVLRLLAGLEPVTAGRIEIGGRDVTSVPPKDRDVGMVFQDYALYPHLRVRDNLAFGMRVRKTPAADVEATVARVAGRLELNDLLDRYPDQLSGGQQQRVALARAMTRQPAVYLLDEPLSNLDAQLRARTRAEIVELHRALGSTTVYVTHDQVDAMTMADRVAVLDAGRLLQIGPPQEVYDRPASRAVAAFVGSPPMNLLDGGGCLGGAPDVVVGVRPEALLVDPAGALEVTVSLVEALGSETVLWVRARDGAALAVRVPARSPTRPGDVLRLRVVESRRHEFDAASGMRR